MPKGPQGQKRPADAIGLAVMIGKIATGEIEEDTTTPAPPRGDAAKMGGDARARKLTAQERSRIAKNAAKARWEKGPVVLESEE